MQESDLVYLLASFPDADHLVAALRALRVAPARTAVLQNRGDGDNALANRLGVRSELDPDVELDEGQRERLEWHLEHSSRPVLAVAIAAVEGREARLKMTELGGEMMWAPDLAEQVSDVDVGPPFGTISDEPPLPGVDNLAFDPR